MKISCCAYRPWIRDSRIVPDKTAIATATGYSFSSGHSMNGGSLFGGLAINSKSKQMKIACWIMVALVAFSRIFLGVHTPQDILVGVILAPVVMLLIYRLLEKYGNNEKALLWMVIIPVVLNLILAVYASVKNYPVDLDAAGNVLVDGAKMANDTFKNIGWSLAFFIGWFIEKKWINFQNCKTQAQAGVRLICGLLGFYVFNIIICPWVKSALGGTLGTTASCLTILH